MIDKEEAKYLFEIKCSLCHSLDRPASKKKSYDGWLSAVHRMISHGAPLTDEEAEIIAAYLAIEYGEE
jgi:mono/diheme cytochrome c family protein